MIFAEPGNSDNSMQFVTKHTKVVCECWMMQFVNIKKVK